MVKYIFSVCLFFVICEEVDAQCATEIPAWHIANPPLSPSQGKSLIAYNLNKTLSVNIFIVASGFNVYDFGAADYELIWAAANLLFEPINLQFEICSETLIPNYNYNDLNNIEDPITGLDEEQEMRAQYYIANTINVYYVGEIQNIPPAAGYAYFPGGPDIIVLTKSSSEFTLAHEIGHFFGLYHTFEEILGLEFVNGSNCAVAGDLLCDTPADNNGPVEDCVYDAYITDANNDPYTPVLNNIMSYYPDECVCKFTNDQYNRMAWQYLTERNYLW